MNQLSGAGASARLAHAILAHIHGAKPGDISQDAFPAPEGRVPVEMCLTSGGRSNGSCGETLIEWAKPDEAALLAATQRESHAPEPSQVAPETVALAVTTPEQLPYLAQS